MGLQAPILLQYQLIPVLRPNLLELIWESSMEWKHIRMGVQITYAFGTQIQAAKIMLMVMNIQE